MGVLVAVIFVVSFVYAIYVGSYNQDEAYLMTTTRAWELAFGGLLALAGSSIRLPRILRGPAGWLGVALIATCGIFVDGAALFPGRSEERRVGKECRTRRWERQRKHKNTVNSHQTLTTTEMKRAM